jgi:hypothetical protein
VGSNLPAGKNINLTAEIDNRMVTNEQYVSCCFGVFRFTACTDCSVQVYTCFAGQCQSCRLQHYENLRSDVHPVRQRRGGCLDVDRPPCGDDWCVRRQCNRCTFEWVLPHTRDSSHWYAVDRFFSTRRLTLILLTVRFVLNTALSAEGSPDPADFVVRSLWNSTHA